VTTRINWDDRIIEITALLDQGLTLQVIGETFGVSRQRMYQVFEKFGLQTPVRQRKSVLKEKPPEYYWLNRMLCNKGVSNHERKNILENIKIPTHCPILGVELNFQGTGIEGYSREENSPSIDQVIAGQGYTLDNIAVMSWRANRIKNNGTANEHRQIADFMDNYKIDK